MSKILIIGANGFIGANLMIYMLNKREDVYGTYHRKKPDINQDRYIYCDVSKKIEIASEYDVVIDLASQVEVSGINDYVDNTIFATRNIVDFCERTKVKMLIFASSISVYGECVDIVNEESDRVNLSYYGMAKYISEKIVEESDIPSRYSIRLSRILGKGANYSQPWLPSLVSKLIKNQTVYYFNPDLLYNNFVYTDDLFDFYYCLIKKDFYGYECIGVGGKNELKILDIINFLKERLNSKSKLIERTITEKNTCYLIDISKAQTFGFNPVDSYEVLSKFAVDSIEYFGGV